RPPDHHPLPPPRRHPDHRDHHDDPDPDHHHDRHDLHGDRPPPDHPHDDVHVDHHDDPAADHDHDVYDLHDDRAPDDDLHDDVHVDHHDDPARHHHGTHLLGPPVVGVRAAGDFHRDRDDEEPRRRHPDRHGDLQGRHEHPRHGHPGQLGPGDVRDQHAGGRLALDHRVLRRRRELQGKHLAQVHPDREPLVAPLTRRTGVVAIGGGRGAEAAGGEADRA